jgi:hypothetical protein
VQHSSQIVKPLTVNRTLIMIADDESYDEKRFVKPQSRELKCPICFDIMKNPVQCLKGHNFCRRCILQYLVQSKRCSTCREPTCREILIPNRGICSLIEDAKVYCFSSDTLEGFFK